MTNVRSSHNANTGADIDNTLGGNVTITNSAFDYNGTGSSVYGLYIRTKGVVTINGISASHNYNSGIDVAEFSSLTFKNAVLNGSVSKRGLNTSTDKAAPVVLQNVTANYNGGEGLDIQTAGTISLNSVDTHENFSIGINLDNDAGTGTVTLTNIRTSNNNYDGLYVEARGAITLTSVSAFQKPTDLTAPIWITAVILAPAARAQAVSPLPARHQPGLQVPTAFGETTPVMGYGSRARARSQ